MTHLIAQEEKKIYTIDTLLGTQEHHLICCEILKNGGGASGEEWYKLFCFTITLIFQPLTSVVMTALLWLSLYSKVTIQVLLLYNIYANLVSSLTN